MINALRQLIASMRAVRSALLRRTVDVALWNGWAECPESDGDPQEWRVVVGSQMPPWAWNALVRFEIEPYPKPLMGQLDWGGDGVRIVANDKHIPLGEILRREDLAA